MKAKHLVWIRRVSQAFFLILFVFLLVESRLPQDTYLDYSLSFTAEQDIEIEYPVTFFFRVNPLVWLTSLLSGHIWITGFAWALGILVVTLLAGRLFCGFVCPLGTLHHLAGAVKPSLKGRRMVAANQKKADQKINRLIDYVRKNGALESSDDVVIDLQRAKEISTLKRTADRDRAEIR